MIISQHLTDKAKAEGGKWFEYEGSRFLIAAAGTPRYNARLGKQGQEHRRALRKDGEQRAQALEEITTDVLVDCVLLDWEGVKDTANGQEVEVPFSKEVARALLEQALAFRQWVQATSADLTNFVREEEAADKAALKSRAALEPGMGGSPGVSGGTSGGGPAEPAAGTPGAPAAE